MIGKLLKITGDPAATVAYVFNDKKGGGIRGELLGGTLLEVTPERIAAVLSGLRASRPDLVHPIHHAIASCEAGIELTGEQWLTIGSLISSRLLWNSFIAVKHSDSGHSHVHYIGSQIGFGGETARGANRLRDYSLMMEAMREAERIFRLKPVKCPDREARPHGRCKRGNPSPSRHPKHSRKGRLDDLLRQIADCEAEGYRSIRLLQELQRRGWSCDIRWKEGRAAGLTWIHSSGARIRGARAGRSIAWLRGAGGIPGLRCGRLLPSNWVPRPIQSNRHTFNPKRPVPRTLGTSWWDRLAMWAWQLVTGDPVIPDPVIYPPAKTPGTGLGVTRTNNDHNEPPQPRRRR